MRKAAAAVLVVVFVVPLVFAALSLFSVSGWILERSFYLQLVSDERIYEALLGEVRQGAPELELDQTPSGPIFDQIPAGALWAALQGILTPAYLRSQAVSLVNQFFDALDQRAPYLELHLDLAPLKEQLAGPDGGLFAAQLAPALPVCAPDMQPVVPGAVLPRCRPASWTVARTEATVRERLPAFLAALPDRYPLPGEPVPLYYDPDEEFWLDLFGTYRLVWLAVVLAAIAGGFWIGAAFVGGRNRREILRWLGWPLVPPAALVLLSGLAIRAVTVTHWLRYGLRVGFGGQPWYTPEIGEVVFTVVRTAINAISRGFLISGGITAGVAVGLIVWSAYGAQRRLGAW